MRDLGRLSFFSGLSKGELWKRGVFLCALAFALVVTVVTSFPAVKWIGKPFPGFLINQRMVLAGAGQYHWTGTKAGLNYPDKVLKANGITLNHPRDLKRIIERNPIGDNVVYTIEQEGKILEVAIPTMRFEFSDFLVLYGIFLLAGIFYLVNVVVVFLMKPEEEASQAFAWTFLSLAIFMLMGFDIIATHLGFIRVYIMLYWMIPSGFFYLSLVFPEKRRIIVKYPALRHMVYAIPLVMLLPMQISYPGPLYLTLYTITDFLTMGGILALIGSALYSYFRKTSAVARQRAKVILFGALLAFPIPAFIMVLLNFMKAFGQQQILVNLLVVPPLLIFPFSVAYAIVRHNLFDVDVFIKRTVGYALMTAVVGAAYLGLQIGLESVVLAPVFGLAARKVTPVLFAVLVVFLFNPVNRRVQEVVDRMFYRKKFDYKATVTAVSDALSSVLDLDAIVEKIVRTVRTEMFIDRSGLVLAGAQGETLPAYFVDDDPSGASETIRNDAVAADDPLIALIREKRRLVTRYDIAEDPNFADVREMCSQRFEELGATLAVPLVYQGEVKAVLAVGHKKSGHFFTREDVDLLQTLASNGAVAIENAHMAVQMKKEETVRTNLSRYLSPQIVERIVKHDVRVNLGGDRKVVTVLFSDIRNFTTITESRPPDQLVAILNEYFTEMAKVIFDHQGSLDKYIGDAMVAVFGSLIPLENPPRNAVAAAVGMMKKMSELNRHWEARYGFSMSIGIGINTGEVFLGNIGSPERMEFTVIGDTVNVASRFSGLAKAGQILVTKETRVTLGPGARLKEHPPAEVKGKSEKMEVFEVLF